MSKGSEPAFPFNRADGESGLTKREYYAAMALQGVESANFANEIQEVESEYWAVNRSVTLADLLIAELEKIM